MLCRSKVTTSCEGGAGSSGTRSTQAASSRTKLPSSSMKRSGSSMEVVVIKWSCPTVLLAKNLEATILEMWMGRSKATSPMFPGWWVGATLLRSATTVRMVFHVEPEAELEGNLDVEPVLTG